MNILSIDTSDKVCGVSIEKNGKIKSYDKTIGLNHSVVLFDMIIDALKDSNIEVKDLDYIAVSNGPGSYTGLRIGVSAALGLSMPYDIPIVYIDTLESLSYNVKGKYKLSIIDAKANRSYVALFDKDNKRITKDEIINNDELKRLLSTYKIKGLKKVEGKTKSSSLIEASKHYDIKKSQVNINYMQASQAERNLKQNIK